MTLEQLNLTTEEIQNLVTIEKKVIDIVSDNGSIFPNPKGYNLIEETSMLGNRKLTYQYRSYFY